MGLAYPASTLTALGLASAGQEGAASASLQVAETVGVATGTGVAGALFALAAHVDHPNSDGLMWAFLLSLASILVALAPAARLVPTAQPATPTPSSSAPSSSAPSSGAPTSGARPNAATPAASV
jgi:hypothetical protein